MPIDYSKYPPNWRNEIVPRILERDNYQCQHCFAPRYGVGYRDLAGRFIPVGGTLALDQAGQGDLSYKEACQLRDFYNEIHQPLDGCTYLVIVLTVAHLDQDEENWQVKNHRLMTLCQYCHLQYDRIDNIRRKRKNRLILAYSNTLFPIR